MANRLFDGVEGVITGKNLDVAVIKEAEKSLGLKFSEDYKEYLQEYTIAMYDGHELTGLGKNKRTNVVNVTLSCRGYSSDIPQTWYVLEEGNVDGIVVWQDDKGHIYLGKKKISESLYDYVHK